MTEFLHGLGGAERERIAALRAQGRFFWLDVALSDTSRELLVETLDPPRGALRLLRESGHSRASRALHADGASIGFVLRCYVESDSPPEQAASRLRPVRVDVVVTADYLITLHDERVSLPAVLASELPPERDPRYVVYAVLDAMLETTFDGLEEVELTLEAVAATSTDEDGTLLPRATLREAGARLASMRRWVTAEQAVFGRLGAEIGALRGFGASEPSFDRLNEQVDRTLASIDAAASTMGMLLDLQLNQRAYLVSVVATIFVPLTFVTGFFGMNFGWMVDQLDSELAFLLLGLTVPVATAVLAWRWLVRRFLLGGTPGRRRR
jgi:magnesium transporter